MILLMQMVRAKQLNRRVEESVGLKKDPLSVYSAPTFELDFRRFQSAQTLRHQYEALSDMIFASARVKIGGREYTNIVRNAAHFAYVPMHHAIGITHILRKRPNGESDVARFGYELSGVFLPTRAKGQSIAISYEHDETGELQAVRVANPYLPLLASTNMLDANIVNSCTTDESFNAVANTALVLRRHVIAKVFEHLTFVNGRVEVGG